MKLDRGNRHSPAAGLSPAFDWTAAVLLVVIAGLHVAAFPVHVEEAVYIGTLFLLYAGASVVLAAGVIWRRPVASPLAAVLTTAAVVLYVVARTSGLPDYREDSWTDPVGAFPVGLLSLVLEGVFLLLYVVQARPTRRPGATQRQLSAG